MPVKCPPLHDRATGFPPCGDQAFKIFLSIVFNCHLSVHIYIAPSRGKEQCNNTIHSFRHLMYINKWEIWKPPLNWNEIHWCCWGHNDGWIISDTEEHIDLLFFSSSLLGSSFPRNPLTYQKGGFLEILFLGVGLISNITELCHAYYVACLIMYWI